MKSILTVTFFVMLLSAFACNKPLTPPNQTMGASTRHARAAMVKNPDAAAKRTESHTGMSATTAEAVTENYKRNQKAQQQQERNSGFGIEVNY